MNIAPHDKNDNNNYNAIEYIDSSDSFIVYLVEIYNTNPLFNHSLHVGFLKFAVAKMSVTINPRYAHNVVNFYSMLEATSRKGF